MKILLLGGSGFLSGTMARCASQAGHEVWTVTRGKRANGAGVRAIFADRKDRPAFSGAIDETGQRWDVIIDCIGFDAEDARQDVDVFASRTDHLIFISTDFLLSPVDRPWKVDETYQQWNDTPYGTGKRAAEEVLLAYARASERGQMRVTILRPCHIYGPGSLLGCLPRHGRDPELIDRMKRGESITLVGGGYFLQMPVFAQDLWQMAMSCPGKPHTHGEIYFSPGPDIIHSREFYQLIAETLGVNITIEEVSITDYLAEHPEHASFCAHRVYSTEKARDHGLVIPTTRLDDGLPRHVRSMLGL
jgi:nucleoside-diphosphate-sugar epimerase